MNSRWFDGGCCNLISHYSICSRMSDMADFHCQGLPTASFSVVSTWLAGQSPPIGSLSLAAPPKVHYVQRLPNVYMQEIAKKNSQPSVLGLHSALK